MRPQMLKMRQERFLTKGSFFPRSPHQRIARIPRAPKARAKKNRRFCGKYCGKFALKCRSKVFPRYANISPPPRQFPPPIPISPLKSSKISPLNRFPPPIRGGGGKLFLDFGIPLLFILFQFASARSCKCLAASSIFRRASVHNVRSRAPKARAKKI